MKAEANWHPKREAKRFEPPPWEREKFEALRREREAERAAQMPSAEETPTAVQAAGAVAEVAPPSPAETPTPTAAAEKAERARPAAKLSPEMDARADAMLIQLGAEEPKVDEHLKVVGVFGSAVAMFFGVCMLAWGLYAMATARGTLAGTVGALIVLGMGLVFAGLGLWFGWRVTNRGE